MRPSLCSRPKLHEDDSNGIFKRHSPASIKRMRKEKIAKSFGSWKAEGCLVTNL